MIEVKPKIEPMEVKRPMTKKQLETIVFLAKFTLENKRRPTIYEIMKEFNLKSTCSAWERIKRAEHNLKNCPFCNRILTGGKKDASNSVRKKSLDIRRK